MTRNSFEASWPRRQARLAGFLYLIVIVAGFFAEIYVRGTLIVHGNAAATAHNILASELLFRLGLAADTIGLVGYVWITFILYRLLKPSSAGLSFLAALFGMVGNVTFAVNLLNHTAPLLLLKDPQYLSAFNPEQIQTLAMLFLRLHNYSYIITMIFFGIYVSLLGLLILQSIFLPRLLGWLLVLGGAADILNSAAILICPDNAPDSVLSVLRMVGGVAEILLCLWLMLFGVNGTKWHEQAETD